MGRTSSSFFIQTAASGYVAVTPRIGGGVDGYRKPAGASWSGPQLLLGSREDVLGVALIESTYGNLEMVVLESGRLSHYYNPPGKRWFATGSLPGNQRVYAGPAFIQNQLASPGNPGNFEVLAVVEQGLAHWYRDNSTVTWAGPQVIYAGDFRAVSLMQTNYPGNPLEAVALRGSQLVHLYRDPNTMVWSLLGMPPAGGVVGAPGVIQSNHGQQGNFEVAAPVAGGGLAHYWRDNDGGNVWHGPTWIGGPPAIAAALIQDSQGRLEAVGLGPDFALSRFVRDDGMTWKWMPADIGGRLPCPASLGGQAMLPLDLGIVGIHAAALRTGKVVYFAFSDQDAMIGVSRVFEPAHGTVSEPAGGGNQFCSGHAFLPDGKLVVFGGHDPEAERRSLHVFDPDQESWTREPDMPRGRWYPTATALPDGRLMVISGALTAGVPMSGAAVNNSLAFYDGAKPFGQRMSAEIPLPSPWAQSFAAFGAIDLYPFVFVLPSGQLMVHSRNTTRLYDTASNQWGPEMVAVSAHSRTYPGEGSAVLLPLSPANGYRPRVLVLGGGGADPSQLTADTPATNTAEILDLGAMQPSWRSTAPMTYPRVMVDAVLLPDGTVLAVGGGTIGRADNTTGQVLTPELFDPVTETWTLMCDVRVPRGYHGSAILLPDGRVALAGKDGAFQADIYQYPDHRIELFSPPYLFKGGQPEITAIPTQITYGAAFTLEFSSAAPISRVLLMRPGAVTHQCNMEQRQVVLDHVPISSTRLSVTPPPNANLAPPGQYMCFLLDSAGVPSVAGFTALG